MDGNRFIGYTLCESDGSLTRRTGVCNINNLGLAIGLVIDQIILEQEQDRKLKTSEQEQEGSG